MKHVLDAELNNRILSLAPRFEARDVAPATFEEVMRYAGGSVVPVWAGASDRTIYGEARVNHAFRAWHDSLHVRLDAPFTLEGETRVALEQARLIGSDAWAKVMLAEVIGQAQYFQRTGSFPIDQVAYMRQLLKEARL